MSRALPCFRAISGVRALTALAATALVVAGCAGANNVTSSQGDQPYPTSYGLSSAGTTTSLYTELFGPAKPAPATATAAAEPVQGAGASAALQPAPPAAVTSTSRQTRAATASATARQIQPSPPPVEVAQQPVAPQPPPEQDVPVAYGITANGPTTDLYTELFGPRRSNGQ